MQERANAQCRIGAQSPKHTHRLSAQCRPSECIAPAFSVAVCFIWFPWMRCYPEHPAPARNRLVVPVAAQSLPVLPAAEPQTSIGSMIAESAVLVALAEQEKAVVVAQVAAPAEQVGVVRAVVAVQVAQA